MSKHTTKALRSATAVTSGSTHTPRAMSRTSGFPKLHGPFKHTQKAISHARTAKQSPQIQAVRAANSRRNFTGVPKTR